jgi:hypothetical protein
LALRTVSAQDSRNIIGAKGCECLPNPVIDHRAEGYYMRGPEITLYQLPRVEDAERRKIIEFWERARPRRHLFKPAV